MIDTPIGLALLAMSLVGTAVALARRRRRPPTDLTALSTPELRRLLASASSDATHQEVRRRFVYLVYAELDRHHTSTERY
jgi:hypothetical protein